ncbi:MAG: efflux RND transporter periplasmic adaptor subunit [Candidatus Eisenbacteria bacterium]|uniref:Efflux RND transporter periplasmic adaptor subunit n=1 Tax=Eiseniibacteriota bacterium TaxID=2212470 RepID=A0A538T761_UNCEI|nr:MAG: efflux RND transporter periplasmic adaptor subunit [Candidatus Eisenbacteria bacterium]
MSGPVTPIPPTRSRRAWRLGAAAAAFLAIATCALLPGCAARQGPRAPRVAVTVATAAQRAMPFALQATGTVEPLQTAAVGSQVGGVITRVAFREGDQVQQGQVLFELDHRSFRAELDQARAALARSREQAEVARLDAERGRALIAQGALSQADWDQKRSTAETAEANLLGDSAAVETARLNLEYASIRAPISGRTGRLMAHEGDYVKSATSDPLITINQQSPVRVRFTVPVSEVPLVQRYRGAGTRVIVTLPAQDTVSREGPLAFVDNAVDPASGTLLLKGELQNRDGLLVPGQFVDVRLVLYTEPKATVVPAPAVATGQAGTFVYVLNPDSTVTARPVQVSRTVDEMAVLAGGLEPGETVVTDGQFRLSPGARVMVRAPSGGTP